MLLPSLSSSPTLSSLICVHPPDVSFCYKLLTALYTYTHSVHSLFIAFLAFSSKDMSQIFVTVRIQLHSHVWLVGDKWLRMCLTYLTGALLPPN